MDKKICANCGAAMPAESKFCTECGTPFPAAEKKEEQPKAPEPQPEVKPEVKPEPEPQPAPTATPAQTAAPTPIPTPIPNQGPTPVQNQNPNPAQPQPQGQPYRPGPTPQGQPYQPAQPVNPAQAARPAQPAQPVNPAQPVRPAQPAQAQTAAPIPTPIPNPQTAQPRPQPAPMAYGRAPMGELTADDVAGTKYEPVKSIGWVGIDILMGIPVVGFILTVVWACGGCRKQNKRTFARGKLIEMAIALILALIMGLALRGVVAKAAENYAQENGIQYSDGTVVKDVLNSFLNQFGYEIAD